MCIVYRKYVYSSRMSRLKKVKSNIEIAEMLVICCIVGMFEFPSFHRYDYHQATLINVVPHIHYRRVQRKFPFVFFF